MVDKFILQWHLSENCNLKCLHCYQEGKCPIMLSYDKLIHIYEEYKNLLKKLKMKGHINITGGEPLCNPFFFKILDKIKKDSDLITFSILTNGTLITKDIAKKIKSYNPQYVQVSLEGGKKTNDYIRGRGTYKLIARAIKYLRDENIYTSISFTANSLNYKEFPKVVKYGVKHHVNNIWSDRYIPLNKNDEIKTLDLDMTRKYLEIMQKERCKLLKKKRNKTSISMQRALQFQMTDNFAYGCTAGNTLLTVMENGDLVPCRRMPIYLGNVLEKNMYEMYKNHPILKKLRNKKVPDECILCENANSCHGGLKCLTYAIYGDLNHKDIGCNIIIDK